MKVSNSQKPTDNGVSRETLSNWQRQDASKIEQQQAASREGKERKKLESE